ncbi:FAD-dependent oxidoreductase [Kibdelosporangium philippinense]|uniref:FAD-dependent oxidoreductase n=1 Tax=Kibdelosporangium philippinense TaxID=211113 RepID=A0ABS8ZP83_9PSEU|nr:FAD-dependent oxidoreductase [Kibdelosporangium philippinense]MCE7009539.1 FAD-dependent oxidoreductase [Kibdelosporangium philippinense]
MTVVILGAGYAGLSAAGVLRRADVDHVLVNRTDYFVERVRLHQVAAGQDVRHWPLEGLVVGTVDGLDLQNKVVHVGPREIPYDTLVYALGSSADLDSVPGVREHAFAVADLELASKLRAQALDEVVVVGAGLTGIETAAELAETGVHVTLVADGPVGGWLSARAQKYLMRALARMGVAVRRGRVVRVGPDTLQLGSGEELFGTVVWAAGFRVPDLARAAGLEVDETGRIVVDDWLRSVSHPDVYAIGDAATGTRMSCQTGLPMGKYVGKLIAGRTAKPVRIRYVWQNISLGRRDGVSQFTRADDSPLWAVMTGRMSAWFKEIITRAAARSARR